MSYRCDAQIPPDSLVEVTCFKPGTPCLTGDPNIRMKCCLHQQVGFANRPVASKVLPHCDNTPPFRRRSIARRAISTIAASRLCERWLKLPGRMRRSSRTLGTMPKIRPAARARSYQSMAKPAHRFSANVPQRWKQCRRSSIAPNNKHGSGPSGSR